MLISKRTALKLAAAGISYMALGAGLALADTKIDFYYPVQVGGPVTKVIDGYVQKFMEANPGITVAPMMPIAM